MTSFLGFIGQAASGSTQHDDSGGDIVALKVRFLAF